jgi:peptidyl-tRNA hydrolase, PTH2 family
MTVFDHTKLKQVLVVRRDLKMSKGKLAGQAGHAFSGFLRQYVHRLTLGWAVGNDDPNLTEAQIEYCCSPLHRKVVVATENLESLLEIHQMALARSIYSYLVTDAGLTQFDGPTQTCCAIGPETDEVLEGLTGHLPLL